MPTIIRRLSAAAMATAVAVICSMSTAPAAYAIAEPVYNPERDVAPSDSVPAPPVPMKMGDRGCVMSAVLENSQFESIPINTVFEVPRLNQLASGRGQTVAVIDSGVAPNVRLANLVGGGDYVMGGDGLEDCDHHGTIIAGIIAARPQEGDGFVGVAPEATILSIRQSSEAFVPDNPGSGYGAAEKSASNLHALSEAIVHAANLGATVINMSVTACFDAGIAVDTSALAGALYYASVVKNVVLVSSAGNVSQTGGSRCKQNPGPAASSPADPRGWGTVVSVSLPSMWSQFVLSVGGTTLAGEPYGNSMGGPWVGVAAPAEHVVSLNPNEGDMGTLVNAQFRQDGIAPIDGTSFAAAYVSGLAALIREKYPELTANQVVNRIKNTAHSPAGGFLENLMGYGVVDAVAALTATVDVGEKVASGVPAMGVSALPDAIPVDHLAKTVAIWTVLGSLGATAILALILLTVRASQYRRAQEAKK
ncbi:MAG: type VII secretion-associated serine protease mycosin [Spirochaetes bacterium]|nr:MAG: type VII secretion-associated serine protease mycosin [Spirochaetota bacterium]